MTPTHPDVKSIFGRALVIESQDRRAAYLDEACAGLPAVRAEVEELLAALNQAGGFMRRLVAPDPNGTAAHEPSSDVPGVVIGPYKLLEKIGEGGMGEVWVADQLEPIKRRVALKLIKPGMDSRGVLARFEAERQALAVMDHPNISKVLDAGTTPDGRPYFVMELVKGTPITEFCDIRKLTPKERLELFVPVCQAIQHAHMKGIIHRDIKPSNVLVELYDDKAVAKVIDFGVAKAVGQRLTEKTIYTGFGALVGTPAYMAPEQATFNALDVDTRADVYALGVLLYELLAGSPPIEKERMKLAALDEVLRIVRDEEPPRPSQRLSTSQTKASIAATRQTDPAKLSAMMKGEIDWIVMKALEKDRARRYDTATALAKDVQRYLAGDAVEACPPTLGYRLKKTYRRNRAAVQVASAFALLLFVGVVVSSLLAVRATDAERQARADRDTASAERDDKAKALAAETEARGEEGRAKERLRRTLYASEMNLTQAAYRADDFIRVKQLLDRQKPTAGETDLRGFEWHYWDRQMNQEVSSNKLPGGVFGWQGDKEIESFNNFTYNGLLSPDGSAFAYVVGNLNKDPAVVVLDPATGRELLRQPMPAIPAPPTEAFRTFQALPTFAMTGDGKHLVCGWPRHDLIPKNTPYNQAPRQTSIRRVSDGKVLLERTGEVMVLTSLSKVIWWPRPSPENLKQPLPIEVWDSTDEKITKFELVAPDGQRQFPAALSSDGTRLAVRNLPERLNYNSMPPDALTVRIIDLSTGEEKSKLSNLPSAGSGVALSPDGNKLGIAVNVRPLAAGTRQPSLEVWDVATGKRLFEIEDALRVNARVGFNPDGTRLIWASSGAAEGGRAISVRDATSGQSVAEIHSLSGVDYVSAFTPDGRQLRTVGKDGVTKLWNLPVARPLPPTVLAGQPAGPAAEYIPPIIRNRPLAYAVDRECKRFLTAQVTGKKWTIQIVDVDNTVLHQLAELDGLPSRVVAAFSPDGTRLAIYHFSLKIDGPPGQGPPEVTSHGLQVWNLTTKQPQWPKPLLVENSLINISFTPDGQHLALFSLGIQVPDVIQTKPIAQLIEPDTGKEIQQFTPFPAYLERAAFAGQAGPELRFYHPIERRILVPGIVTKDQPIPRVLVRDLKTREESSLFTGPAGVSVLDATYSADGQRVAIALGREEQFGGKVNTHDVRCRVVVMDAEQKVTLWEREMPEFNKVDLRFAPDNRKLVIGHMHGSQNTTVFGNIFHLAVADAHTGKNWMPILEKSTARSAFDISPDGTRLLTGQMNGLNRGVIRLWDITTGRELISFPDSGRGGNVKFSPDGQRLYAMGSSAGTHTTPADVYDGTPLPEPKK